VRHVCSGTRQTLCRIVADDADTDDNGRLTYSISVVDDETYRNAFEIDPATGHIYAMHVLPPHTSYGLTVGVIVTVYPEDMCVRTGDGHRQRLATIVGGYSCRANRSVVTTSVI
jgi:hypothetical protein